MTFKRFLVGVGAMATLVLIFFVLFGEKRLDTGDAADKIAAELGPGASVECPDDVTVEDGATFECTATLDGTEVPIEVELVGEDGDFRFAPVQSAG